MSASIPSQRTIAQNLKHPTPRLENERKDVGCDKLSPNITRMLARLRQAASYVRPPTASSTVELYRIGNLNQGGRNSKPTDGCSLLVELSPTVLKMQPPQAFGYGC